jgi:hypothetical protein
VRDLDNTNDNNINHNNSKNNNSSQNFASALRLFRMPLSPNGGEDGGKVGGSSASRAPKDERLSTAVLATPILSGDRPQRWMKMYRTEIAASSSSVLSTCIAVSITPWLPF